MNKHTKQMLMERMEDKRSRDMRGMDMARRDRWEYNIAEDEPFMRNAEMREDGLQGVKGTGRYGIGGSQYYPRRDRAMNDMNDYERGPVPDARLWRRYGEEDNEGKTQGKMPTGGNRDYMHDMNDYGENRGNFRGENRRDYNDYADEEIRLPEKDLMKWKKELHGEDGSWGERFTWQEIMPIAKQMGVRFDKFTEKEFCFVVNMLYSDMCLVWQDVLTPQNELHHYVAAAKQWLTDKDALQGSEKLAAYYVFIVEAAKEEDGADFRRTSRRR